METKHTKGHWRTGLRNNLAVIVDKKDSTKPTICDCNNMTIPQIEAEANAKLIAAAPILLDALITLINANPRGVDTFITNKAKEAIKKATE